MKNQSGFIKKNLFYSTNSYYEIYHNIIQRYSDQAMHWYSGNLRNFLDKWPGKKRLGIYRFLPIFFVLGAALEFSMINWTVGETNFYRTYKKRQAKNLIESKLAASIAEAKTTV